jgi:hypothetical protein
MSGVRMTHPDSGGEYPAAASQVPFLKESGWQVVPGQEEQGEEWPAELQRFDGQEQVRIHHPETGGETVVARSAVPFHRERGWLEVEEPAGLVEEPAETDSLDELTVEELKDEIRTINKRLPDDQQLPVSGTKPELLERVRSAPPAEAKPEAAADETEEE